MNVKKITHEELADLVKEGRDIVCAIDVQHPNPYKAIPRSYKEMPKVKPPEEMERLRGIDIKRDYQLWYSKALTIMCNFLPLRFEEFKSFYEFPKSRSELRVFNYRVADHMRGIGLPDGSNWRICLSLIEAQCNILESAQAFIDPSQAYAQLEQQVPDGVPKKLVPVGKTAPAPSRKKKRKMDDDEKRKKERGALLLKNVKRIGDLQRRIQKGEKVNEEEASKMLSEAICDCFDLREVASIRDGASPT